MAFTQITVTGIYKNADNSFATGAVSFRPIVPMRNGDTVIAAPVTVTLNGSGAFSLVLAATTDPSTSPPGVTYEVVESLTNQRAPTRFTVALSHLTTPVNLATLVPVPPLYQP